MTSKEVLKELRKQIYKEAGERCRDHSHFCYTCKLWDLYDALKEALT